MSKEDTAPLHSSPLPPAHARGSVDAEVDPFRDQDADVFGEAWAVTRETRP
jgi:hypothetical protein